MNQHDADAITQIERDTWNRSAASYIDRAAKLTTLAVDILIEAAHLTSESRALEIGCGPGHITKMMADTGAEATGVDLAPEMVKVASELHPNIEFREAHAERLPFDAGTFDAVLVNFVFHHFARPEAVCAEIHRVLKPNGRLVFAGPSAQTGGFGGFLDALTTYHTIRDERPHGPISTQATEADFDDLLQETEFGDCDVNAHELTLHLENLDPVIETGWEMFELSKLPQQTQDKIREMTLDNAAPYKTDRGYEFPSRVIVGVATK
ncbi:MAG: class I SAM-dependent methyltransferase [SAR202 cluster bacterium]|nr:class I SAM-dependent methyltransferase [SAR202 cluster bacterium]MQG59474.1 class I SAM-dependent methyltransferase [SAR202 cluster bacterium]MQG70482.1 class I SAM-dependent methyltransferase [SAR202 cluster bacterium]HAL49338.1 hypothetical protein [Dehalococcoidia bacterium]|tara:strand:+ start:139 stop:933 length:795 start_codon:yes stop_codon:yes gene_type:complete